MEPLKELFYSKLSYERVSESLSRRGWTDTTSKTLAEDPLLLAAGGAGQDFHVIYSRLDSDKLLLGSQRPVVTKLLREHPYSLFVFSNADRSRWHFVNVKYEETVERRRLFRRITVGRGEHLRTASERVNMLDLESISPELFGLSPLAVQARHDAAFDVQPLSDEFFTQYAAIFAQVEGAVSGIADKERRRYFVQRLFNRLMFVAFIQKKGWLEFESDADYLDALWRGYKRKAFAGSNFYTDRLKPLFFSGLSTKIETSVAKMDPGGFMDMLIGKVPYLNGGLFDEEDEDRIADVTVPDGAVDAILHGLFGKFNFTIDESTSLDVEVAVDPEMLGRVFEELVTGRHETGSYYTIKIVVSFMCREALERYLVARNPAEDRQAIQRFVELHDPSGLRDSEAILASLRSIRVADLACGSGAYLLGMMHELLDLRACLFSAKNLDPLSTYARKLEIIERNIYGVDSDPFAVNIARLRLWLSLVVEFEGDDPPPLPNLDFKIEVGDSLSGPNPEGRGQLAVHADLVRDYQKAKAEFLTAHGGRKRTLRAEVLSLKAQFEAWSNIEHGKNVFDWSVEFAEVMSTGGFDAIVANPPYVRADPQFKHIENEKRRQAAIAEWKLYRESLLKSGFYRTLYEKWDFYIPFLERGFQLLRPDGSMVFIISDAYNAAKYATRSHDFFLQNATLERIDFCSDIPLFDAGVNNTIVHFTKRRPVAGHEPIRVRRWGESKDDFEQNTKLLPTGQQLELKERLFRPDASPASSSRQGLVPLGMICYISYGLRANADDRYWQGEFKTDDCLSATKDKSHPKRFVQGKDLVKWCAARLWYLEWGTKRAPGKFSRPTFLQLHEASEKLLSKKNTGANPTFVYDDQETFFDSTVVGLVPWHLLKKVVNKSISKTAHYRTSAHDGNREEREAISRDFSLKYLMALLNSTYAKTWLGGQRRHKLSVYPDDWKDFPVPQAPKKEQDIVVKLVDRILAEFERRGYPFPPEAAQRVEKLEREIDERVAGLYGL
jgi:methylase of polypeptide subunit release factors